MKHAKRARPIVSHVDGAPHQRGDRVRVVTATDVEIHDVSALVGCVGRVVYLEYSCGCGQAYPHEPMIGVAFRTPGVCEELWEEFWPEEIEAA